MYDYDCLYGLNPPVYIDTGGDYGCTKSVTEKGIFISGCQACHPRQGESHPDMGESLLSCIFMAHQSGPHYVARTPEGPLIQDSLNNRLSGFTGCRTGTTGIPEPSGTILHSLIHKQYILLILCAILSSLLGLLCASRVCLQVALVLVLLLVPRPRSELEDAS